MANAFDVHPPNAADGIPPTGKSQPKAPATRASGAGSGVEISEARKLVAKIHDTSLTRMDIVERVKGQIAAGTYETPERIEATINSLVEEFFPELR